MTAKEAPILFYVNPTVSKYDRDRIIRLADSFPRSEVLELKRELSIPESSQTIVACGGDGTALSVAEQLHEGQVLIVDPCGSQNGLANSLRHEGSIVNPQELRDPQVIETIKPFKPGVINGTLFVHGASWDSVGLMQADVTEQLRWALPKSIRSLNVPKKMRAYVGAAYAALRHTHQFHHEYPISLALVSGLLGRNRLNETQTLYSDHVLIARIPGGKDLVPRLTRIYFHLFIKQIPPHGLITFVQDETFTEQPDKPVSRVVVDGEVKKLDTPESVATIRRSDRSIKAALLDNSSF